MDNHCFIKGTRVLTNSGYKSVEQVTNGDRLLTHTGVFRDIINIQNKQYYGIINSIQFENGTRINCTEEHPFYVRTYSKSRRFSKPYWKPAKDLTKHDYSGMVINRRSLVVHGLDDPDEWFVMGYFIFNGWLSDDCTIGLNITDSNTFDRISKVLGLDEDFHKWDKHKYVIRNSKWHVIFEELHDSIPEWVHNAPTELLEHFVDGIGAHILDGLELSLHLERIYFKLEHTTSAYIDGDYAWFPIESIDSYESTGEPVYNFEVVIDNSYIVENRIVHNCQTSKN
jgi:intein/homing endonuclease